MKQYRLTLKDKKWELAIFTTQEDLFDLAFELRNEGIISDSDFYFARGEENPNGYFDRVCGDYCSLENPFQNWNPELMNLSQRLTEKQEKAFRSGKGTETVTWTN